MQLVVCLLVDDCSEDVCLFKAANAPSQARLFFRSRPPEGHQRSSQHFLALPTLAQLNCNRDSIPFTPAHLDGLSALRSIRALFTLAGPS